MFDFQKYLKAHHPGCVGKARPITYGVKLSTRSRQPCSLCGTRTPVKLSCFSCAKVLCGNCRVSSASEFALVIGNKKGICKSCMELVIVEDQESSSEDDSESDDGSEEAVSEDEDIMMSSTNVPINHPSNISKKNYYAFLVADNIKLVYLKKSLVEEIMKEQLDCWESKVVGSFVRVKTDPYDYSRSNYQQLAEVRGITRKCSSSEVLLKVLSNYVERDIPVSQLSDCDFTEEECEDLRQDVANCHLLRKPTVFYLEHKARELHEDITKHWIRRKLVRLQHGVDWANERGQRDELDEYLEQRELLKQACEQERLLKQGVAGHRGGLRL